ncbi:MAG: response regulator [Lachnospiraceae bacterium]|nr:response regulator [Lachnospiraceae bacterium]
MKEKERILIVDDDRTIMRTVGQIIRDAGMQVGALPGGQELLDYVAEGKTADLILLDIYMPGMNGFETLRKLREYEKLHNLREIPVVILTADESQKMESHGFTEGALDYIRKPVEADVLIHRVRNILRNSQRIMELSEEAASDPLTGLPNKASSNQQLIQICKDEAGTLLVIDLDSFKLVNDLYGHEMGDRFLSGFAEVLRSGLREGDVAGRIGGDEFVAFLKGITERADVRNAVLRLNNRLKEMAEEILKETTVIPLGVSAGAVITPGNADFKVLFSKADKALYMVKQNGKHDCEIYNEQESRKAYDESRAEDLRRLSTILNERNVGSHALWLGQDAFGNIYRYMLRYIQRYHERAYKLLFTINPINGVSAGEDFSIVVGQFGEILRNTLRNSDIMMQSAANQFFLLLPMVLERDIQKVVDRILLNWKRTDYYSGTRISYETESVISDNREEWTKEREKEAHIYVVDDDVSNMKIAGMILSDAGMHVTALNGGRALLDKLSTGERPDLILLDVLMPDMDGFETYKLLRGQELSGEETPVIFLTADDDDETETLGLTMGAMDFIRKPFVPDILIIRVRHTLELVRLQRNLTSELVRKTSENEELFLQVVQSLAGAIDAKDAYTNGHSRRVAEYAREIATRYGYSDEAQNNIYVIGLLHDVGKIGIPDEVINKTSRLTDEEFAIIKTHPEKGAVILTNIRNMPNLVAGARWHHERYGGGGYPDGLSGEEIPEEARIIAVADAYDAMTSNRSYRNIMSQAEVRAEIERCSGSQFDPRFADIMLRMIDEDIEYNMREKK